jgi:hypothetical protein
MWLVENKPPLIVMTTGLEMADFWSAGGILGYKEFM